MADPEDLEREFCPLEVEDEVLQGGAVGGLLPAGQGRQIPIVSTIESALDLPPNLQTGAMPARGGVADNLPPLPPSLGSVSGRVTEASGYTPQEGGGGLPGSRGRASSVGSIRSASHVRRIGDRTHLSR